MKKILNNGLTIVLKSTSENAQEVSLTFKCGHVNEPKIGIAAVYENIVKQNANNLMSICGGSMTSFVTGVKTSITVAVKNLYDNCVAAAVTKKALNNAIEDIVQHTKDLAPLPLRQAKLAYKHTAFGKNEVFWKTDDYIDKISQLTVDDVKAYITDNFVAKNVVLGYCGPKKYFDSVVEIAEQYFGALATGKRKNINLEYTGGYQNIEGNGKMQIALFGWDISKADNTASTNVLMSMLSGRLERSIGEAHLSAEAQVKIAGYFGLRTLRIAISCANKKDYDKCIDIVCRNVKRLQTSEASDRRIETSRQRAMSERLGVSNEALPRSVEIAWALLGRDIDYDADSAISNIWNVTAYDVQETAQVIFSKQMTCVFYTTQPFPSFEDIKDAMSADSQSGERAAEAVEDPEFADADPEFTDAERAAIERIDALNAE